MTPVPVSRPRDTSAPEPTHCKANTSLPLSRLGVPEDHQTWAPATHRKGSVKCEVGHTHRSNLGQGDGFCTPKLKDPSRISV